MRKNRNDQKAFEYALYMIASSYFDKAVCTTQLTERNLLLHYKEENTRKQFEMEDFCIRFMNKLERRLGTGFFENNVFVKLVRKNENSPVLIVFSNEGMSLKLSVPYTEKKRLIRYRAGHAGAGGKALSMNPI